MTVVNMKVTRQKLMQTAILNKVEREHLPLDTVRVRRSPQSVREHVSRSPYFTDFLDRWERIVEDNDVETLRQIVESDDETGNEMRNLSPLYVLLTEDDRMKVLDDLRELVLK